MAINEDEIVQGDPLGPQLRMFAADLVTCDDTDISGVAVQVNVDDDGEEEKVLFIQYRVAGTIRTAIFQHIATTEIPE